MALDDMDELLRGLELDQEPLFTEEEAPGVPAPRQRSGRPARRARPQRRPASTGGLRAWQRFILSFFLFWDVVIVGLLLLLMLERMILP